MVEVEVQIRKILDLGVIPTPGASQVPLLRGIASVSVSTLGPIFVAFAILSFYYAHDLVQGLWGSHGESWYANPSMDAARQKARHASNGSRGHVRRGREISVLPVRWQRGGEWKSPLDPCPPARGETELGLTLPPPSSLPVAPP
jgi:hypothetical protein